MMTGEAQGVPQHAGRLRSVALRCAGLSKRFGKVHALNGLNLQLEPGASVGLVGRNGAGKSTLFRCIVGAEQPDAGHVQTDPPLKRVPFLANLGFVPDSLSAYDWMTVGSAVDYVAAMQPHFDAAWNQDLMRLLALDRSARIRSLSRGMQARLAFVLGLSHRPALVLLDEPLLGVDAVSHDAVLEVLARMRAVQGCTMLIASHQLADLARLTDRVAFMDGGRVVEEVDTDHLVECTKRIMVRPAPGPAWVAPEGTVLRRVVDGAMLLTLRDFQPAHMQVLQAGLPGAQIEVLDLSINEACADRLRAMEVQA